IRIAELAAIDATLVLFESGARVEKCLRDLADILGPREAAVCRELTKLHEDIRRAPLPVLAEEAGELETRGEFVLVIGPPSPQARVMPLDDLDALLRETLRRHSLKDAVAQAMEISGHPRRDIYARALELSRDTKSSPDRATDDAP